MRLPTFVLTGAILLACEAEPITVLDTLPSEGQYGLLVLSHDVTVPGVAVSGQWMVYRGQSKTSALHALAQPEQAWMAADPPPPGTCRSLSTSGPLDERGSIDLLDVGTLEISPDASDTSTLHLTPRPLPPIAFFALDGVVYDADAPEQLPYLSGERYRVQSTGGETGPSRGWIDASEPVWLEQYEFANGSLQISWSGAQSVRVLLTRETGSQIRGLECSGRGDTLEIPARALTDLGSGPASLTINQVNRAELKMSGFAHAELLFVARDGQDVVIPEVEEIRP